MFAIEAGVGENPIQRIDKGSVSDFNIYPMMLDICRQLTGISEYNAGIAARERTATGAAAVTQSSQKRLAPFLEAFVAAISQVARMKLNIMRQFWTDKQYVAVADISDEELAEGIPMLSNKDLTGVVSISLELDGIFSAVQDLQYRKLLEVYTQFAGKGIINEAETGAEIMKALGISSNRIILPTAPQVSAPTTPAPPLADASTLDPNISTGNDLTALISPQTNFGNEGQGQQ